MKLKADQQTRTRDGKHNKNVKKVSAHQVKNDLTICALTCIGGTKTTFFSFFGLFCDFFSG